MKDADFEELDSIKNDIVNGISSTVSEHIEDRLKSHKKDIKLFETYRKLLANLPELLHKNDKPIVIVIDELDRCKPLFAIQLIEKIKHFFSVKKITFVLVINKNQLEESIRMIYGQKFDAHNYLQKFITIETTLPKVKKEGYKNDLGIYCRELFELHDFEAWGTESDLIEMLEVLVNFYNLTLRQLEKVFINITIFYSSSTESQFKSTALIAYLSIIKVIYPSEFNKIIYQEIKLEQLLINTKFSSVSCEGDSKLSIDWVISWLKYSMLSDDEFSKLDDGDNAKTMGRNMGSFVMSRMDCITSCAKKMNMFSFN